MRDKGMILLSARLELAMGSVLASRSAHHQTSKYLSPQQTLNRCLQTQTLEVLACQVVRLA